MKLKKIYLIDGKVGFQNDKLEDKFLIPQNLKEKILITRVRGQILILMKAMLSDNYCESNCYIISFNPTNIIISIRVDGKTELDNYALTSKNKLVSILLNQISGLLEKNRFSLLDNMIHKA